MTIQLLKALCAVDSTLAQMDIERRKIEEAINKKNSELIAARNTFLAKEKLHSAHKNSTQNEEKEIAEEREKLVGRRKALSTLNNYKVQQAAEKEIELTNEALSAREDKLLGKLETLEDLNKELETLRLAMEKAKEELVALEEESNATFKNLDDRRGLRLEERSSIVPQVNESILENYERIRGRYPLNPLAKVDRNACSGCFMQLGAQVIIKVATSEGLIKCPSCGRILHLDSDEGLEKKG